jgi:hypothetical protein
VVVHLLHLDSVCRERAGRERRRVTCTQLVHAGGQRAAGRSAAATGAADAARAIAAGPRGGGKRLVRRLAQPPRGVVGVVARDVLLREHVLEGLRGRSRPFELEPHVRAAQQVRKPAGESEGLVEERARGGKVARSVGGVGSPHRVGQLGRWLGRRLSRTPEKSGHLLQRPRRGLHRGSRAGTSRTVWSPCVVRAKRSEHNEKQRPVIERTNERTNE